MATPSIFMDENVKNFVPTGPLAPAIIGNTPENPGAVETQPAPSLMQRASSYVSSPSFQSDMGSLGQAVMGRHQDSWQANMGKQLVEKVKKDTFSKAFAKASSRQELTAEDYKGLDPEQISELEKTRQAKEKQVWDREDQLIKRLNEAKTLGLDEDRTNAYIDNLWNTYSLERQKLNSANNNAQLDRTSAEKIAADRNATDRYVVDESNKSKYGNDARDAQARTFANDFVQRMFGSTPDDPRAAENAFNRAYKAFMERSPSGVPSSGISSDPIGDAIRRAQLQGSNGTNDAAVDPVTPANTVGDPLSVSINNALNSFNAGAVELGAYAQRVPILVGGATMTAGQKLKGSILKQ